MMSVIHCYNGEKSVWGHQIGFRLNPRSNFIAFVLSFMQIASFTPCLVQLILLYIQYCGCLPVHHMECGVRINCSAFSCVSLFTPYLCSVSFFKVLPVFPMSHCNPYKDTSYTTPLLLLWWDWLVDIHAEGFLKTLSIYSLSLLT